MKKLIECSHAIAEAVKLCKPKVIAAYPITPQTHIVERLSEFTSDGKLDAEFVRVESEHSAMSVCIGASATGARAFTATNSQGLALMSELLPIASGMRLPVVMAVTNRALSAPLNIWNDHSDSMAQRDYGWIQLFCESSQEAVDTIIQAYKIAEAQKIPVMVCVDGFSLSHLWEPVIMPDEEHLRGFLPDYDPEEKLCKENPLTFGALAYPAYYKDFKKEQQDAMNASIKVIKDINSDFGKRFGRTYGNGLIEEYQMEDAKQAIVLMGSACGVAREVIDRLREKKKKIGMIRLKSFRPFPAEELKRACKKIENLAVIDRAVSLGSSAPLFTEIKACLEGKIRINSFIAGLGGKDMSSEVFESIISKIGQKKEEEWV